MEQQYANAKEFILDKFTQLGDYDFLPQGMLEKMVDKLIALAGEEHYGPPPLFEQSSVYYQDARSAKEKFVKYDANAASVSCFFSKEMWDDADFSREFNYYATELYSSIEGDDENAGK